MSMQSIKNTVKTGLETKSFKKALSVGLCLCMLLCSFCFGAFASESGAETVTLTPDAAIDAAENIFGQITQTVNFANIAKVLGIGLGAVLGIWLAWWGIRKLFRMLQGVINGRGISF